MTFSEVRQYQFGDDIRSIDWNVTARYNEPYIKVFEEERELTMMLMVDISGSESFGTQKKTKNQPDLNKEIQVHFTKSDISVAWDDEYANILEFAESNGVSLEAGCMFGECGA